MKIKIRFVEKYTKDNELKYYEIQQKRLWWWSTIYSEFFMEYYNTDKDELLKEVLDKHFKVCIKYITLIEYPTIKIY